jgi:hypothetical protein
VKVRTMFFFIIEGCGDVKSSVLNQTNVHYLADSSGEIQDYLQA